MVVPVVVVVEEKDEDVRAVVVEDGKTEVDALFALRLTAPSQPA